jgi:hypothetical protein
MRLAFRLVALAGLVAFADVQPQGTVLTAGDIQEPHLRRRPVAVEGRQWLGLRMLGDSSRVERVEAAWVGSVELGDSMFALDVRPTGLTLLVSDVPGVAPGPAITLTEFELGLWPGEAQAFALGARTYTLQVQATDPALCDATVTLSHGVVSQELYMPDELSASCDEPHFSVQWAGDLDGDGRLDLVTTLSPKYSLYPRRLFLSSAAPEGMLVGLVAAFDAAAA